MGTGGARTRGVAIQPADGKLVAVGTSAFDIAIVLYNTDGTHDTSLRADGKVTLDLGGADDAAYAVAIDGSGNIVVAGETDLYSTALNSSSFLVARHTWAGGLLFEVRKSMIG